MAEPEVETCWVCGMQCADEAELNVHLDDCEREYQRDT